MRDGGQAVYRPTCHYAYHPCNDAVLSLHEMFGQAGKVQEEHHILDENEIVDGIDELGVLLYGHGKNAYWYGSQLSIEETRALAPYQNATGLQVTSAVLAGMVWALENPEAGIVEADEMDFRRCLEIRCPISARWWASTPTGRRSPTGRASSRRTSTSGSLAVPQRAGAVTCQRAAGRGMPHFDEFYATSSGGVAEPRRCRPRGVRGKAAASLQDMLAAASREERRDQLDPPRAAATFSSRSAGPSGSQDALDRPLQPFRADGLGFYVGCGRPRTRDQADQAPRGRRRCVRRQAIGREDATPDDHEAAAPERSPSFGDRHRRLELAVGGVRRSCRRRAA